MRLKITTPKRSFDFAAREGSTVIVVGTRPLDDICIDDDPKVSGPHVRLEGSGQDWSFTDQFSDAGTIHNGAKTYNGELKQGDVLKVGDTEIRVLGLEGAAAAPAPAFEPMFDTAMASPVETPGERAGGASAPRAGETPATPTVFVQRIIERLIAQFQAETTIDIRGDAAAMLRVREAAAKAVQELESEKSTEVNLPFLAADSSGPKHLVARIVRKHLHETDEPVFQAGKPQAAAQQHQDAPAPVVVAAKPNNKPGVAIAVAVVMIVGVSLAIFTALEDSADVEQDVQRVLQEAQAQEAAKEQQRSQREGQEKQLKAAVLAILEDKESRPQDLLDQLDALERAAIMEDLPTGWDFERVRTQLESRVYADVANRSNDVSGKVYDLQEAGEFRQAEKLVREFETYMNGSRYNERAITILELHESVERWSEQGEAGSEKLLAEQIPAAAEALSRDDFAAAASALEPVVTGALLDAAIVAALESELADLRLRAEKQARGQPPAARKPYDKRKDKLPDSPDNKLLKAGDYTARTRLTSIRYDIIEGVRKGEWDGRMIQVWGLSAEVRGDSTTTYVPLVFTRAAGGQTVKFTAREQLSNFEPAVQLALFEQAQSPELQDLMAMLIFAFDNGLNDDAGRIALKVREAAPDNLAELDAILAAKWKVAIPEGGFPERDGRVVQE